jgi:hypothetical protein
LPLQTVADGFPLAALEAPVLELATSFLARLAGLFAPLERRQDLIAIPLRRDDRPNPRHDGRRH